MIVNFQKAHRAAGASAAAQFFLARTQRRKICAGAGTIFEEHRFARRKAHDVFHVVLDRLDEARAALWIFVLRRSTLSFAGCAVVKPVAFAGFFADAVFMKQSDIEPNRRIERAELVHAEPGQFIVKNLAVFFAEIAVGNSPIRNRPRNAMNQLTNRSFALGSVLLAVKIF